MASPCCQKVLLLEKQVWGWGFQFELITILRGKSFVICPLLLLTHLPGKSQVSPLLWPCPSPRCKLIFAWLPTSPWCTQGGSKVTPLLSPKICIATSQSAWGKQGQRGGHLKVGNGGSFGAKDWGVLIISLDLKEPSPSLHPSPERQPELCLVNEIQKKEPEVGEAPEPWKARERGKVGSLPKS